MTFPQQIIRFDCPIESCAWALDDPGLAEAAMTTGDLESVPLNHALNLESKVRAHMETHPLLEWVTEVVRLQQEASRGERDASVVAAVLVRRLGGTVDIYDADLAAESGTLTREPIPCGFRLRYSA